MWHEWIKVEAQPIGLMPRRRSAFTFKAPEGAAFQNWSAVVGIEEDWYFKPDAGQLFGSPANADDSFPHDVLPEDLDIALGMDRIMSATNLQISKSSSQWAGLRTFAPDGEMVIGFDDSCPQFFWLVGQGGYGIQSAAGYSSLAATLIQHHGVTAELESCEVEISMFDVEI
jgi:D-arginine dehydrogenase